MDEADVQGAAEGHRSVLKRNTAGEREDFPSLQRRGHVGTERPNVGQCPWEEEPRDHRSKSRAFSPEKGARQKSSSRGSGEPQGAGPPTA